MGEAEVGVKESGDGQGAHELEKKEENPQIPFHYLQVHHTRTHKHTNTRIHARIHTHTHIHAHT
jgi:hypothetical protein